MSGESFMEIPVGDRPDEPMFSRGSAGERVELRGLTDRWIADVLDAVCHHQGGRPRIDLINEVLHDWARRKVEEANVIQRVTRPHDDGGAKR